MIIDNCRADTRSEAGRSYNETIIRPVTRRLHTPAGTSVRSRSSRSHAGTSEVSSILSNLTLYNRGDLKILPSLERASGDAETFHTNDYDIWLVRVGIWQGFNLSRSEIDCK